MYATKLAIAWIAVSGRTGCGLLMNDLADRERDTRLEQTKQQLVTLRSDLARASATLAATERDRTARERALEERVRALEAELHRLERDNRALP